MGAIRGVTSAAGLSLSRALFFPVAHYNALSEIALLLLETTVTTVTKVRDSHAIFHELDIPQNIRKKNDYPSFCASNVHGLTHWNSDRLCTEGTQRYVPALCVNPVPRRAARKRKPERDGAKN